METATGNVEWHKAVFSGVQSYTDMAPATGGLVYGYADRERFFVFDAAKRAVVHEQETRSVYGLTNSQQGPRVFVVAPDGTVFILFVRGVAKVDAATYEITMLAESPVPIGPGGDIVGGRVYFASGSHLYSYEVPNAD
jgi:hypothetical protein